MSACGYTVCTKCVCVCSDSLFKDVLCVHPPVILGQFDGEDDAGDEKDTAASQTEPERVLENTFTIFHYWFPFIFHFCHTLSKIHF